MELGLCLVLQYEVDGVCLPISQQLFLGPHRLPKALCSLELE